MKRLIPFVVLLLSLTSCGIYSFSGTSIKNDVNTITINYIEYRALRVNPSFSNDFTEAIRNQFRRMTRLEQVDVDGDMELSGEVTGYEITPAAVTADEVAARNKLTVTVKIQFTDKKHPEEDFDKSFSAFSEYDSTSTIDAVESSLCAEIIEKLVEELVAARKVANKIEDEHQKAIAYHDTVAPMFDTIRRQIDKLELIVDDSLWPLPKYRELLFIR